MLATKDTKGVTLRVAPDASATGSGSRHSLSAPASTAVLSGPTLNATSVSAREARALSDDAKRVLDVLGALLLLTLLLPLAPVLALLVAMDGGPVVFSHERIGRNGVSFGCLKFRTMIPGAAECLSEYLALHPTERETWECEKS